MFVRTQDNKNILEAISFSVEENEIGCYPINRGITSCWFSIGVYSSPKRAIEVLNLIEKNLFVKDKIFKMPKK